MEKAMRIERERLDKEELGNTLEDMDNKWEHRKDTTRKQKDKKRIRPKEMVEDDDLVGGVKKRAKRMKPYIMMKWTCSHKGSRTS